MKKIKVNVLFFGIARDLSGSAKLIMEITEGTKFDDCRQQLESNIPQLAALHCAYAVNQTYVNAGDFEMHDGDELAVLPPVSGG